MLGKPGKKFSCCHCHQRETFWSSLYWRRVLSGLYMHYFSSVLSTQITLSHPPTPIPRLGALAKIQHDVNTALIGSQLHMSSFTPELKKSKMPSQHPPKEQRQTLCQAVGYSLLKKAKNIRGVPFTQGLWSWQPLKHEETLREQGRDAIYWFQPCYNDLWKHFQFFPHYMCDFHPNLPILTAKYLHRIRDKEKNKRKYSTQNGKILKSQFQNS